VSRASFQAAAPERLPGLVAEYLAQAPVAGPALRVAVDGCSCVDPPAFGAQLLDPLRALGRPAAVVRADSFWRDASLRLEYGHTDLQSFAQSWLDEGALTREVLAPLGSVHPHSPDAATSTRPSFLPSLRDPATSRATREPRIIAEPSMVVLVCGELLLGRGLDFDVTVHLALGASARARRISPELAWTLPAFEDYDRNVDPLDSADVVIRLNDPRHPAISLRPHSQG
jgi:hypothetical protein